MPVDNEFLRSETPNGVLKRYAFVVEAIRRNHPQNVLDIGCGTGSLLTGPLAAQFPHIRFTGVDADAASIEYARRNHGQQNLEFIATDQLPEYRRFDMIIASEVIEHVEEPIAFLVELRRHLRSKGVLVLTMPNGYGPYELTAIIESLLHLVGILPLISWIARMATGGRGSSKGEKLRDTLAHSPHINWFSQWRIRSVMQTSGFAINSYLPRVFLCGLGLQHLLRTERMRQWNASVADRLPAVFNSGWMFIASKQPAARVQPIPYRRTTYEVVRRLLSELRWSEGGTAAIQGSVSSGTIADAVAVRTPDSGNRNAPAGELAFAFLAHDVGNVGRKPWSPVALRYRPRIQIQAE